MKKLLILAALCSQVQAESVPVGSKFYIDLGVGLTKMYGKATPYSSQQAVYDLPAGRANNAYELYNLQTLASGWGNYQLATMLNVGYDCKLRDSMVVMGMFLGGGYGGGLYSAPYSSDSSTYVAAAEYSTLRKHHVGFREKGRFNVGFRMGVAAGSFFPHIRLGWSMHFVGAHIRRPNADTVQLEKYKISKGVSALTVGCGVDYQVTQSFILGALFDVSFGKKTRFNFSKKNILWAPGQVDTNLSVRLKPTFSTFLVTAKWAFPTCR